MNVRKMIVLGAVLALAALASAGGAEALPQVCQATTLDDPFACLRGL